MGSSRAPASSARARASRTAARVARSEEHTSELQSLTNLVCRLLLEKKKNMLTARWAAASRASLGPYDASKNEPFLRLVVSATAALSPLNPAGEMLVIVLCPAMRPFTPLRLTAGGASIDIMTTPYPPRFSFTVYPVLTAQSAGLQVFLMLVSAGSSFRGRPLLFFFF